MPVLNGNLSETEYVQIFWNFVKSNEVVVRHHCAVDWCVTQAMACITQ